MHEDQHHAAQQKETQTIGAQTYHHGYNPHWPHQELELARIYFPIQQMKSVYPTNQALKMGTLFPELYRGYPQPKRR